MCFASTKCSKVSASVGRNIIPFCWLYLCIPKIRCCTYKRTCVLVCSYVRRFGGLIGDNSEYGCWEANPTLTLDELRNASSTEGPGILLATERGSAHGEPGSKLLGVDITLELHEGCDEVSKAGRAHVGRGEEESVLGIREDYRLFQRYFSARGLGTY